MISPKISAASAGIIAGAGPSTRTADRLPSSFVSVLVATTHDPPTRHEAVTRPSTRSGRRERRACRRCSRRAKPGPARISFTDNHQRCARPRRERGRRSLAGFQEGASAFAERPPGVVRVRGAGRAGGRRLDSRRSAAPTGETRAAPPFHRHAFGWSHARAADREQRRDELRDCRSGDVPRPKEPDARG